MLLGNKTDLTNFREVSWNDGYLYSKNKKIPLFYETSALLNRNIDDAMREMTQQIVCNFNDSIKRPLKLMRKEESHRGCI